MLYFKYFCTALLVVFFGQSLIAQSPELRIPAAHECEKFAFSKDDKLLITLGNNEVKIWDMEGPYLLKTLKWKGMDTLYNKRILITPDQQSVWFYGKNDLRSINLRTLEWTNTRIKTPEGANMTMMPDGKSVIMLTDESNQEIKSIQQIDLATGKTTKIMSFPLKSKEFPDGVPYGNMMEVSSDGQFLMASGYDSGGIIFDLKNAKVLRMYGQPLPMFFLKNGNYITSTNLSYDENNANPLNQQHQIEEIETSTGKTIRKQKFALKNDDLPQSNGIVWISHDHKSKILYENAGNFYVFDTKTWSVSPRRSYTLGKTQGTTHFVHISDGGKYLFTNSSLEGFSLETGNRLKKVGFFPYLSFNLSIADIGDDKGILSGYKHLHFDPKGFRVSLLPGKGDFDWLQRTIYRIAPAQKMALMTDGLQQYQLTSWKIGTDTSTVAPLLIDGQIFTPTEIRVYDDNNTVLLADFDRFIMVDSRTFKIKQEVAFSDGFVLSHFSRGDEGFVAERSPDRSKVLVHLKDPNAEKEIHYLHCYDLLQKRLVWEYHDEATLSNAVYAEGGKQVWVINEAGALIKLDAASGKVLSKSAPIPYANSASVISPSTRYITNLVNGDERVFGTTQINIVDTKTLQLRFALKQQNLPYIGSMFYDNDRFLISYDEDVKIWDVATGRMLARIVLVEASAEWIVVTADGRFDASKAAMKTMHYVQGREHNPLEQLYEGFYTPGLLHEVMYGTAAKSSVPVEINKLKFPPTVRIVNKATGLRNLEVADETQPNYESSQKTVLLSVEADGKDDKITEVRLYHNGKLLNEGTRGFKPVTEGSNKSQQDFEVNLLPGMNQFRAVAINSQRTESKPGEIAVHYTVSPEEKKMNNGITLHLVVIGINQYKNTKHNLNYAEADALGFKDEVAKNCGNVVSACKEYYITNEKAVKEGITAALETISSTAKPEDVFMLYYAGHGVMAENKEFYLVPHDVTQIYGNDGGLAQKGLSATELRAYSTKIKAQKQLFILDACHSSGALEAVAQRGAAEEKAIAQLARSTGTHWLTAAGTEQYASEFTQLGHGVFTYVLIEGLKGAADHNHDHKITVKEMDAYLQDQVPALTEKYKGSAQYPSSYGFGQDFPLGIAK